MKSSNESRRDRKYKNSNKEERSMSFSTDKNVRNSKYKDNLDVSLRFIPKQLKFPTLPLLKNVESTELEKVLQEKIMACCIIFNFQDNYNILKREEKHQTLMEISNYLSLPSDPIPDFIYSDIPEMFGCNVFRVLAPFTPIISVGIEDEDDYKLLDSWLHVKVVYEIMLQFLEKQTWDIKKAKRYIDHVFVKYLLNLFDSPDPRERDYLKTILHRIYGKIVQMRSFIRKQINNIFFTFIYETERHNGIAELLEILGSIINGFQIPIKDEHKTFLTRVLLPLHKMRTLGQYHPQLAYCVTEFIKKDRSLIKCVILDGLIKFWPKMQSFKEIMFLNELEESLELCDNKQFHIIIRPLILQISRCVSSTNFQVCERTLYFWTNPDIVELMTPAVKEILPLIFPSLYTSKQHWNKQIHAMVFNALKVTMDMDPTAFDEYINSFKDDRIKEKEHMISQADLWYKMQLVAKKNPLHRNYSESMYLTSVRSIDSKDDDPKNLKNIGAEIVRNVSESDNIVKKVGVTKGQSTVPFKSSDTKANSKDIYLFKS